jgi:hypothetical protein
MINRQEEQRPDSRQQKRNSTGIHKLLNDTAISTYEDIAEIVEARIELFKIELTEKISLVSAFIILSVILIIGIAYLVTTLALLAGELLGHTFLGYLLVSLLFLSSFLFFARFRPLILKNMIQNILLSVHDYKK